MKANSIFRGMMVVVLFMTAMVTMNASAATSSDGIMNNEYDASNNLKSTVIYRNSNNLLTPIYRYDYTYNEQNQLVEKVTLKWNGESWVNSYLVKVSYNGQLVNLNFSTWNRNNKNYVDYSNYDCDILDLQDNIK